MWRGGTILSTVSMYGVDIAYAALQLEMHELAVLAFDRLNADPRVQQQLLWMLSSFLSWPKCCNRIQASRICIEFFQKLMLRRQNLIDHIQVKVIDSSPKASISQSFDVIE